MFNDVVSIDAIAIPETILPIQYFSKGGPLSGEQRLMLAVLADGINCFFGKANKQRTLAEVWLESRNDTPFSFVFCCDWLGVNPNRLRAYLKSTRDTGVKWKRVRSSPAVLTNTKIVDANKSHSGVTALVKRG